MILKKIGVLSLAKISAIIYAFLGLIIGIFIAFAVSLGALAGSMFTESAGPMIGLALGVGAILLSPIFYGILGFILGAATSAIYNLAVRFTGGIELEFEQTISSHPDSISS